MFDPSGLRISGKHLELTLADRFEPSVIHDGTSARGSLVDYQKMVARQWQTLPIFGERPAVGDESSTYHVPRRRGEMVRHHGEFPSCATIHDLDRS